VTCAHKVSLHCTTTLSVRFSSARQRAPITGMRKTVFLLLCFALLSPARAGPLQEGLEAFQSGDYTAARKLWRPLAEASEPRAQYNLGLLYANGWGVDRDPVTARHWYLEAARRGHADAQYNLGLLYAQAQGTFRSDKEAVRWWKMAADQGHAAARYNLGVHYAYGRGVRQDVAAAIRLWTQAAQQGYPPAAQVLARLYGEGLFGMEPDPKMAEHWRQKGK